MNEYHIKVVSTRDGTQQDFTVRAESVTDAQRDVLMNCVHSSQPTRWSIISCVEVTRPDTLQ